MKALHKILPKVLSKTLSKVPSYALARGKPPVTDKLLAWHPGQITDGKRLDLAAAGLGDFPLELTNAHCLTLTAGATIAAPGHGSSVTNMGTAVLSYDGTTVSVTTGGTLYGLAFSDGAIFPCSEGMGGYIFSVAGAGGVLSENDWSATQDEYNYNAWNGYGDAENRCIDTRILGPVWIYTGGGVLGSDGTIANLPAYRVTTDENSLNYMRTQCSSQEDFLVGEEKWISFYLHTFTPSTWFRFRSAAAADGEIRFNPGTGGVTVNSGDNCDVSDATMLDLGDGVYFIKLKMVRKNTPALGGSYGISVADGAHVFRLAGYHIAFDERANYAPTAGQITQPGTKYPQYNDYPGGTWNDSENLYAYSAPGAPAPAAIVAQEQLEGLFFTDSSGNSVARSQNEIEPHVNGKQAIFFTSCPGQKRELLTFESILTGQELNDVRDYACYQVLTALDGEHITTNDGEDLTI